MAQILSLEQRSQELEGMLRKRLDRIALPKHLTPDRMLRIALNAMEKTPKLKECEPASLVRAVLTASTLGLECDGTLGQAYLIPRNITRNGQSSLQAQFQVGYKGLLDLARRSDQILDVSARVVHKGDKWEYQEGTNPRIRHKPDITHVPEAGSPPPDVIAVYAVAHLRGGGVQSRVMGVPEIEREHRAKSAAKDGDAWVRFWREMAEKTLLIALSKVLPASVEFRRALALDSMAERGEEQPEPEIVDLGPAKVVDKPNPPPAAAQPTPPKPPSQTIGEALGTSAPKAPKPPEPKAAPPPPKATEEAKPPPEVKPAESTVEEF